MRSVFVAGRGLASALGPDLPSAVAMLRGGGRAPQRVLLGDGSAWPFHAIEEGEEDKADWTERARRIVCRVAGESGALEGPRTGPLFVASSSLHIGAQKDAACMHGEVPALAEQVAGWLGWRGAVYTVSTACTSAVNALLGAHALVGCGAASQSLVLGVELRNRASVAGFAGMQLLSPTPAQPLGAQRNGLVLGEAVAALHLSAEPARWRLAGGANVVDGRDSAGPGVAATCEMCRRALAHSGLAASDIELVKPQAAGSMAGDAVEMQALQQVFAPLPALVSLKPALGHTLGASGAAELALLMACLEGGAWPHVGYAQDAALGARLAESAPPRVRHVLASILGFGGGHAAVVLEDGA